MISESQNTIMSFFYHIRLANIKKFDKLFKRYDTNRYSVYCWSEYKFPCRGISDKTAYSFNLWAIISLLEIYSEYTSQIKKYKYTRSFILALFLIIKYWSYLNTHTYIVWKTMAQPYYGVVCNCKKKGEKNLMWNNCWHILLSEKHLQNNIYALSFGEKGKIRKYRYNYLFFIGNTGKINYKLMKLIINMKWVKTGWKKL